MDEQRLFGTDGVRGRANVHPMTVEMMAIWNVSMSASNTLWRLNTHSHGTGQKRLHSGLVHMSMN